MKYIPLSQNLNAIVDDEDFDWLNQWKWSLTSHGYAMRMQIDSLPARKYKQKSIYMHKLVNNTPEGMKTDHINRDRLDNRKDNLRTCTNSENAINKALSDCNTSGYKGVSWYGHRGKWAARIQVNRKQKHLGLFTSKIRAAKAYDEAAKMMHGEFAHLNFGDR